MTLTMSEERVAQGIALLDEYNADWWRLVELKTLNLFDPWNCVLGQVFRPANDHRESGNDRYVSGYQIGLEKLGLMPVQTAYSYSLSVSVALTFGFVNKADEPVWRRVIKARQEKARKPEVVHPELVAA